MWRSTWRACWPRAPTRWPKSRHRAGGGEPRSPAAPLTDIHVIGRRGARACLLHQQRAGRDGPAGRAPCRSPTASVLEVVRRRPPIRRPRGCARPRTSRSLKGFAAHKPGEKPVTVHFTLSARRRRRFVRARSSCHRHDYRRSGRDLHRLERRGPSRKREGVFPVGWARRGPSGHHPDQPRRQPCRRQAGARPASKDRDPKSGPDVLPLAVDAAGWHRIDKHEDRGRRRSGRPRVKIDGLAGASGTIAQGPPSARDVPALFLRPGRGARGARAFMLTIGRRLMWAPLRPPPRSCRSPRRLRRRPRSRSRCIRI